MQRGLIVLVNLETPVWETDRCAMTNIEERINESYQNRRKSINQHHHHHHHHHNHHHPPPRNHSITDNNFNNTTPTTNKRSLIETYIKLQHLPGIIKETECHYISMNLDVVKALLTILQKGIHTKARRYNGWSCKECGYGITCLFYNWFRMHVLYMGTIYRLLYILLYNTGIYLDEYTALKIILDEPIGESNISFKLCTSPNIFRIVQ